MKKPCIFINFISAATVIVKLDFSLVLSSCKESNARTNYKMKKKILSIVRWAGLHANYYTTEAACLSVL